MPLAVKGSAVSDNLQTYDIAVSFAGEDRVYVEQVSSTLKRSGLSVFYDGYEKADLWGKDLYVHLTNVYRDYSKYCLMFVSEHYARKQWTNHERRAAQARAFTENREYILPLRLDDSSVDGVLDTTSFVDARHTPVDEIVEMLRTKVLKLNYQNGITSEIVRAEDAFERAGIQLPSGQKIRDVMMETSCPTCGTTQLLSETQMKLKGDETTYECKNGCQVILVVGRPRGKAWQGGGYRIKDYVIRNARDLLLKINPQGPAVLLSASPSALMTQQPKSG